MNFRDKLLGTVVICAITVYLAWRFLFTLPLDYGTLAIGIGATFLLCELFSSIEIIMHYFYMMNPLHIEMPDIHDSWFPDVDVLITTHNEDVDLLHTTVNACLYLDYPDKSKVHIYLCDDTLRDEVRQLAERMGVGYIGMPHSPEAKAGNINNGLRHTSSPLVAILDADMIPTRRFLMRTVPYFFLPKLTKNERGQWVERTSAEIDPNYKIGFIQTPQTFYHPDLFQFNLYAEPRVPSEQMYFFRIVNVGMNTSNTSILCGTNAVISRRALDEVGLFGTGTITEDLHTGMLIQEKGYTTYSIDDPLVNGMSPQTAVGLLRQRERWGRGAMQVMYKVKPFFNRNFSFKAQLSYFNIIIYWWTFTRRYVYIMSPILVAFFDIYIVDASLWDLLKFWLPYYVLNTIAMTTLTKGKRTVHWNNIFDTVLFPYLIVPILLETFGIRMKKFHVTPKAHHKKTSIPWLALPHFALLVMSLAGAAICVITTIQSHWFYYGIIVFWLLANSKNLLLSVFFMLGRDNERKQYRQAVEVPAMVEHNGYVYRGYTVDISEKGFALAMFFPALISADAPVRITLCDGPYAATMSCRLVKVSMGKAGNWIYAFFIEDISPDQLGEYKQIVHDGEPNLPEKVNDVMPVIEDLSINIDRRLRQPQQFFARKLPRILQPIEGRLENGERIRLVDFNYRYTRTEPPLQLQEGEVVRVMLGEGVEAQLTTADQHLASQNRGVCQILNWEDFANNEEYMKVLSRSLRAPMPVQAENAGTGSPKAGETQSGPVPESAFQAASQKSLLPPGPHHKPGAVRG